MVVSPHENVVSPHENASRLPNEYESNTLEIYRGNFEVSKKEHCCSSCPVIIKEYSVSLPLMSSLFISYLLYESHNR